MSIQSDDNTGLSDDSAIEQLTATLIPVPKKPANAAAEDDEDTSEDDEDEEDGEAPSALEDEEEDDDGTDEDADEDEDEEGEEEEEEEEEEEAPGAPAPEPSDDAVVKVVVDGQETEVTIGSLKRLAGQEASLTRKSQEAELVGGRAAMLLQGALNSVLEELEPYKDTDWELLRNEMEPEEFRWHRENFTKNQKRFSQLMDAGKNFEQLVEARQANIIREQAAEARKELEADIPGWNDQLYAEVMQFGIDQGLDEADVRKIANAKVFKLLHMAMQYKKGEQVVTKKINQSPTRVKKSSGREAIADAPSKNLKALEKKLQTGRATDDDAVALLLGRWNVKSR